MNRLLKKEIAKSLAVVAAELESGRKSKSNKDRLKQLCSAHGIPLQIRASRPDMEFGEYNGLYQDAYKDSDQPKGVQYLDQLEENQEELSGEEIMAQVEQLQSFAADGKLDQYLTVMEHQVEASTGDRAVANQLLVIMARGIKEKSPKTVSRSLRKLTAMATS